MFRAYMLCVRRFDQISRKVPAQRFAALSGVDRKEHVMRMNPGRAATAQWSCNAETAGRLAKSDQVRAESTIGCRFRTDLGISACR
jgi:hypothetical protein